MTGAGDEDQIKYNECCVYVVLTVWMYTCRSECIKVLLENATTLSE